MHVEIPSREYQSETYKKTLYRGKTMCEEKLLEMRGMRRQEIIDYFSRLPELECHMSIFRAVDWTVEVGEEVLVTLGKIKIPSTTVKFTGRKDSLEQAIYRLRLRFLSAGG